MADEELHFVTYDPDAIWDAMQDAYIDAGGDILYGGDEKEILLRSVQEMFVTAFAGIDNALRMQTVRYAQGDYLKLLGEERGCAYTDATSATGEILITLAEGYQAQEIEAGTTFTPDGQRFYALDTAIEYTGASQQVKANITCTEGGEQGNGVSAGTKMEPVKLTPLIVSAEIVAATAGGSDAEDIEAYRERVREAPYLSVTTGPAKQYRAHAMAVSTEIYDAVVLLGESAGTVCVYLVLDDGADASSIIAAVTSALSADDVRPLTDVVTLKEAAELEYKIDAEYVLPENSLTVNADAMQAASDEYQEWQEHTIGRAFDPYQLIAALYKAGAERVTLKNTSTVTGHDFGYVAVNAHTRPRGKINLSEGTKA